MDKTQAINKIKEHLNFNSDAEFSRYLGITPQNLSNWKKRNTFDAELLYTKCLELNPEWLLTGEGDMLKPKINSFKLQTDSVHDQQLVPFYDMSATASVIEVFGSNKNAVPLDYIKIPNLPKCDGAITITGDSMYPLLKSGDTVMYKEVNDFSNIVWGEMYIIYINNEGDEFFFCKYLHKSTIDNHVKLVSQNQHHQPKDFPMAAIKQLAIVKASIRVNSIV